jgi:transposase
MSNVARTVATAASLTTHAVTAIAQSVMRAAMNAILYLLRTGCPWRCLPRDGFPPRSTVYNIFRKFQREGAWEAAWAELHMALREQIGREPSQQPIGEIGGKGAAKTTRWVTTPARR